MEPGEVTFLGTRVRAVRDYGPRGSPSAPLSLSHVTLCPPLLSFSGNQVFPEVTRLLTNHTGNTSNSEDILSSACYTVRNLMASQPQTAKQYFTSSMVNNVINLCRSRWAGKRGSPPHPHTPRPLTPAPCKAGRPVSPCEVSEARREQYLVQRGEPGQGRLECREVPEAKSTVGHQRALDP